MFPRCSRGLSGVPQLVLKDGRDVVLSSRDHFGRVRVSEVTMARKSRLKREQENLLVAEAIEGERSLVKAVMAEIVSSAFGYKDLPANWEALRLDSDHAKMRVLVPAMQTLRREIPNAKLGCISSVDEAVKFFSAARTPNGVIKGEPSSEFSWTLTPRNVKPIVFKSAMETRQEHIQALKKAWFDYVLSCSRKQ